MKLKKLAVAVGVALSLAGAGAQAQVTKIFQDDNIDFALTTVGGVLVPKTSGNLAIGDVLVSVFEIPTYSVGGVSGIPAGQELTGLAITQVTNIIGAGGIGTQVQFGAYTGGFNAISPVDVAGGGAGGGTVIAMFLNSTADFDLNIEFGDPVGTPTNCSSFAQCIGAATAGTLLQVDGFFGDADEFWTAVVNIAGGTNIGTIAARSGGAGAVATVGAALTTLFDADGTIAFQNENTGLPCVGGLAADDCIAGPTITGPILGGAGIGGAGGVPGNTLIADGAFARSDFDAQKLLLQVPEPGMLALTGLGLLGLAVTRRRRPD